MFYTEIVQHVCLSAVGENCRVSRSITEAGGILSGTLSGSLPGLFNLAMAWKSIPAKGRKPYH